MYFVFIYVKECMSYMFIIVLYSLVFIIYVHTYIYIYLALYFYFLNQVTNSNNMRFYEHNLLIFYLIIHASEGLFDSSSHNVI